MAIDKKSFNVGLAKIFGSEFVTNLKSHFVEKVNGKGLSTNDYTTEDKNKVDAISYMTDDEVTAILNGTYGKTEGNGDEDENDPE